MDKKITLNLLAIPKEVDVSTEINQLENKKYLFAALNLLSIFPELKTVMGDETPFKKCLVTKTLKPVNVLTKYPAEIKIVKQFVKDNKELVSRLFLDVRMFFPSYTSEFEKAEKELFTCLAATEDGQITINELRKGHTKFENTFDLIFEQDKKALPANRPLQKVADGYYDTLKDIYIPIKIKGDFNIEGIRIPVLIVPPKDPAIAGETPIGTIVLGTPNKEGVYKGGFIYRINVYETNLRERVRNEYQNTILKDDSLSDEEKKEKVKEFIDQYKKDALDALLTAADKITIYQQ